MYLQNAERIFNARKIDIINIKTIVKAFEVIVFANTLINNQRENYYEKMHQMMLEKRQTYKNLIHSIIKIVENFGIQKTKENEKNEKKKEKKETMQIDEKMIKTKSIKLNVDMKDNENDDMNELNNDDVEKAFLITLSTVEELSENDMKNQILKNRNKTRKRKSSANKYQKLLLLFNLHVDLHLSEMIRKYAIVMNLNVLSKEMKHM